MLIDRLLDHLRIDIKTAGDDHVLLAIDQVKITVSVHVADVAGQETVAHKRFRGFLWPIPVALGYVRPSNPDFADLARWQDVLRIVERDHVHFDAGQHQPDRARLVRSLLRMRGAGRAGLGHAPAAPELQAAPALEDFFDLDRPRCAARAAAHPRGEIALAEVGQTPNT